MNLSLKKGIFLFLFACFQVLIFFSFNTSFQLVVISLFLAFLLFYFYYFKLKIAVDLKLLVLWLIFLFLLVVSSFFSHSLPFSLEELVFHISSFSIFVFFSSLKTSKLFSKHDLVLSFILIGFVLSVFFIAFFSFPHLSGFLPVVNVFTTIYGHRHFAAFLLIFIPVVWMFAVSKKFSTNNKFSLLALLYLLLILSFGRFAIILGLIQLPFLYKLSHKEQPKKLFTLIIGLVLISVLATIAYFSFNIISDCPTKELRSQVCKPISGESRDKYFSHAILAFKLYPTFGYGPGTFSLIDKKYSHITEYSSIYAHNVFLQMFAEAGIFVGIAYIILIFAIFKKMFSVIKTDENGYIFLGLFSLLLNALVDYDWNSFPIYQISIIFMALLLWDLPNSKKSVKNVCLKNIWLIFTLIIIGLGIVNITSRTLIYFGRESAAFNLFPYFYSHSNYYLSNNKLSDNQKEIFYKIYRNHKDFIINNIRNSESVSKKKELYAQLTDIFPSIELSDIYYKFLLDSGDYLTLGKVAQNGLEFIHQIESNEFPQPYEIKSKIMTHIHNSAIYLIENNNSELAVEYYDSVLGVLYNINANDPKFHLLYRVFFSEESPWKEYILSYFEKLYEKNPGLAKEELLKIAKMHDLSVKNGYQNQALAGSNLSKIASEIAFNELKNDNVIESSKMYIVAQKLDRWIFNNLSSEFLSMLSTDEDKKMFWMAMEEFPGEYIGQYSDEIARDHLILLRVALENDDVELADRLSKRILEIAPWMVEDKIFIELSR